MDPPIPQPSCFKVLVSFYGLNMHHTSCFFEPVTSISTNFFYLDRIFLFFFKCSSISFIPHSLQIHRLYELVSYLKEVCYDLIIFIFLWGGIALASTSYKSNMSGHSGVCLCRMKLKVHFLPTWVR